MNGNYLRERLRREAILNQGQSPTKAQSSRTGTLKKALAGCLLLILPGLSGYTMLTGEKVKKINLTEPVAAWQALDPRHIVLNLNPKQRYLLTLGRDCPGLTFADHLGLSTSNGAVYAGFDYLTADDQRCTIRSITKLN